MRRAPSDSCVSPSGEAWKLFNVDQDRTELNDLSSQQPEIKAELIEDFDHRARRVGSYRG